MKRIVLCCDGTWNRADQAQDGVPCPTNVLRLAYRVAKRDPDGIAQVVFYDQGVGTGNCVDRLTGGAFGAGLEDNILDAYRFLIANFEPGDDLFLFGFSRGAYTARSLAGMIRKCGILARRHVKQYVPASRLYRHPDIHPDHKEAAEFRACHSCCGSDPIPIKCIGVWDTVGALGIPMRGLRSLTRRRHRFHDTELSGTVEHAFHALAIDERRSPFEPTLWLEKPKPNQLVSQTWFPGVHSDVGGGYASTDLSDITLRWVMDNASLAGLHWADEVISSAPLSGNPVGTLHDSKTGLYRFTTGAARPMSHARSETVHPSALDRWDRVPSYRPRNLQAFLRSIGDARADRH